MGYGDSSASKFLVGVQKSDFDAEVASRLSAQAELVAVRTNKFGATFSTVSERVAAIENGVIDLTNSPVVYGKTRIAVTAITTPEQGHIDSIGVLTTSTTRVRSSSFISGSRLITVLNPTLLYKFWMVKYDLAGIFISSTGSYQSALNPITLDAGFQYKFLFGKVDSSVCGPSDIIANIFMTQVGLNDYYANKDLELVAISSNVFGNLYPNATTRISAVEKGLIDLTNSPIKYNKLAFPVLSDLVMGYFDASGNQSASTTRVVTTGFVNGYKTVTVINQTLGYKVWLFKYNVSDGSFVGLDGSYTSETKVFTLLPGFKYKYQFGKTDNSILTINDVQNNVFIIDNTTTNFGDFVKSKLSDGTVKITPANIRCVAHQGYTLIAPNQTLPAYIAAAQHGFTHGEGDIQWTSDGIPVMCHNSVVYVDSEKHVQPLLNGASGNYTTTLTIASMTLATLQTYDFGYWKSLDYTAVPILKFEDYVICCKKYGLIMQIDHVEGFTSDQLQALMNIVDKYGMKRKVTWSVGSSTATGVAMLAIDPKASLVFAIATYDASAIANYSALKTSDNEIILSYLYTGGITVGDIQTVRNAGLLTEVWSIDTKTDYLTWLPYVDSITSFYYIPNDVIW